MKTAAHLNQGRLKLSAIRTYPDDAQPGYNKERSHIFLCLHNMIFRRNEMFYFDRSELGFLVKRRGCVETIRKRTVKLNFKR